MHSVQRYPLTSFDVAQQLLNGRLFNRSQFQRTNDQVAQNKKNNWAPAVDISEQDNQFVLVADVPGFTAGDIEISVDKNVLSVSGSRKPAVTETPSSEVATGSEPVKAYTHTERYSGDFARRFTLPESVDIDKISARVENGELTISIAKQTEAAIRKISVEG